MFDLLKKTAVAAAVSVALLPAAASAVTVDSSSTIFDSGPSLDILGGPYFFGATFTNVDGAGMFTFDFFNSSATQTTVGVTIGTVLQSTAAFTGGLTAAWLAGGSVTIPEGVTDSFQISTLLGAGATDTLKINYGAVVGGSAGRADLDLTVAAVPLPAGGLLLLGALGGLAALRRRKQAA